MQPGVLGAQMTEVNQVDDSGADELRFSRRYRRILWVAPLSLVVFPAVAYIGIGFGHARHNPGGPTAAWAAFAGAAIGLLGLAWAVFNQRYRFSRGTLIFGGFRRSRIHLPDVTVASVYHERKRYLARLFLVLDGQKVPLGDDNPQGVATPSYLDASGIKRIADALEQSESEHTKDAVAWLRTFAANPTLDTWPEPTTEPSYFSRWFKHDWD